MTHKTKKVAKKYYSPKRIVEKTVRFINRTYEQIQQAFMALKLRYKKKVMIHYDLNSSKMYDGWFVVA